MLQGIPRNKVGKQKKTGNINCFAHVLRRKPLRSSTDSFLRHSAHPWLKQTNPLLCMNKILHHLANPGMIPLKLPTNIVFFHGFISWCLSGFRNHPQHLRPSSGLHPKQRCLHLRPLASSAARSFFVEANMLSSPSRP